jgi:hypothetical protein
MQVETTEYKKTYTCNGTGPYPITFAITTDDDGNATNIEAAILDPDGVQSSPLTLASGDLDTTGLNAYTTDSYDSNYEITIYRKMPFTVDYDIDEGGVLGAENLEDEIGTIYMHLQELDEKDARALQISVTDTERDMTLPIEATRANMVLGFDADGKPVASASSAGITVGSEMEDVVSAATLEEAIARMRGGRIDADATLTQFYGAWLNSSGQLSHTPRLAPGLDDIVEYEDFSLITTASEVKICWLTATTFVMIYNASGTYCVHGTLDDNGVPSWGTPLSLAVTTNDFRIKRLSDTHTIVVHDGATTSWIGVVVYVSSGTTLAKGTNETIDTGCTGSVIDMDFDILDSTHFVCVYSLFSSTYYAYGNIVEISGETLTAATPKSMESLGADDLTGMSCAALASDKFTYCYEDTGDNLIYVAAGTVSGTTITDGARVSYDATMTDVGDWPHICKAGTDKALLVAHDETADYHRATMITYSGTTPTVGNHTYLPLDADQDYGLLLQVNSQYAIFIALKNTELFSQVAFIDISGTDPFCVKTERIKYGGALDMGGAIDNNGERLFLVSRYYQRGQPYEPYFYVGAFKTEGFAGITLEAADPCLVQRDGVLGGQIGIVAGTKYWVGAGGAITTANWGWERFLGVGISTSEILITR